MRFTDINVFGVYIAPISLLMVVAWFIAIGVRRLVARFGLLNYVWHPALFSFSIYLIVLCSITLWIAGRN
jgi:protein AaeX